MRKYDNSVLIHINRNRENKLLYLGMTIEIKTPVTKAKVQKALIQLSKETGKKSLRRHFGKLKRDIDGLDYQKEVRNEWI